MRGRTATYAAMILPEDHTGTYVTLNLTQRGRRETLLLLIVTVHTYVTLNLTRGPYEYLEC